MYHPTIQKLDQAASEFHAMGMQRLCDSSFLIAGQLQQELLANSPHKTKRRYLHAQWVWALGHIGLLYQLIRWFTKNEPDTQLVLEANGSANPHFLNALFPHISMMTPKLSADSRAEAIHHAVYFGCPDGIHGLVSFYKMIERECSDINLLSLGADQVLAADGFLNLLGVKRPYVAVQARSSEYDSGRNVTLEEVEKALAPYLAKGYSVVSTGLDAHEVNDRYPSVVKLNDPRLASFLLSASCDQFIGSNSGAWTIPHAYCRPVEIINDFQHSAWIYP